MIKWIKSSVLDPKYPVFTLLELSIENLFLLDRKLRVLGFQHGGGYDIFQIDYFAEYEKRLSDLFFGWGFSEHNKPQKKFKKRYR